MYRPEGWDNPHKGLGTVLDDNCEVIKLELTTAEHRAYEVGADAMLEGLKKLGEKMGDDGYLVFIPEEG